MTFTGTGGVRRHVTKVLAVVVVPLAMVGMAGSHAAVATDGSGGGKTTWIAGTVGDDANPCTRTAPCKTLMGAFMKTSQPDGEILVHDAGNFGNSTSVLTSPTINGGVTIDGSPGIATVATSVAGLDGLVISAAADDVVILRHLDLEGALIGRYGSTSSPARPSTSRTRKSKGSPATPSTSRRRPAVSSPSTTCRFATTGRTASA